VAGISSKTLTTFYQTTRRQSPNDITVHSHRPDNLKYHGLKNTLTTR